MALYTYTGTDRRTYPSLNLTVVPGDVIDYGASSPPSDGRWTLGGSVASHGTDSSSTSLYSLTAPSSMAPDSRIPAGIVGASYYAPMTSLYNVRMDNTRMIRRGISRGSLSANGSGQFVVAVMGASIAAGFNGSVTPDLASCAASLTRRIPTELGLVYRGGYSRPGASSGLTDGRWTLAGGFSSPTSTTYTQSTTAGATATYVSDSAGSAVDLLIWGNSGAVTVTIDGTAKATALSGTPAIQRIRYTGLANTTHTVVITATTATLVTVDSIRTWAVAVQPGFQVWPLAVIGAGATTYDVNALGELYSLQTMATTDGRWPDVAVVGLDVCLNDLWSNTSLATSMGYVNALVNTLMAQNVDVVLMLPSAPSPAANPPYFITDSVFQRLRQAAYSLADSTGSILVDLHDRVGGFTMGTANGYYYDYAHPSPFAAMDHGDAVISLLDSL